jgi:ribose transport system substrate-binding protein
MKKMMLSRFSPIPIKLDRVPVFSAICMAAAFTGCRRSAPTIVVIPRTCGTLLWEAEHTGIVRAARAYGSNVYWNAPMREGDVQGQIDILTQALAHGDKGLIVSAVESLQLRISIHRALLAGTPVVVIGTDLGLAPGGKLAYVLNDEHSGGQMATRRIGELLHGQGTVAVLGISNVRNHVNHILEKLEASDRTEAVSITMQQGIISVN